MHSRDFAVIGLGRFGSSICRTLRGLGHDVLAIDTDMERVQRMRPFATDAVQLDASNEEALRSIGIMHYHAVVVAIGADFENSVLITLLLKELGVKRVFAKASTLRQQQVLSRVGADRVVFPEADAGYQLAHTLVYPSINDFIDLGEDYLILEVTVKIDWVGKTLGELKLTGEKAGGPDSGYQGLQVQMLRRGKELICLPSASTTLMVGDVLAVLGRHRDLEALLH